MSEPIGNGKKIMILDASYTDIHGNESKAHGAMKVVITDSWYDERTGWNYTGECIGEDGPVKDVNSGYHAVLTGDLKFTEGNRLHVTNSWYGLDDV